MHTLKNTLSTFKKAHDSKLHNVSESTQSGFHVLTLIITLSMGLKDFT